MAFPQGKGLQVTAVAAAGHQRQSLSPSSASPLTLHITKSKEGQPRLSVWMDTQVQDCREAESNTLTRGSLQGKGQCCRGIPVLVIPLQVGREQEKETYKLSSQAWVFVFINYEENRNLNSLLMLESYGCYFFFFYVFGEIWLRSVSCKSHPKNAAKRGVFPIPTTPDVVRYK